MRYILKTIANGAAIVSILPAAILYRFTATFAGRFRVFSGFSQALSLIPGLTGIYLRRAFYRLVLPQCHPDVSISFCTVFSHPTARIGRTAYLGVGCMIGDVTIEQDVLIGSHVSVINGNQQHGIKRLDIPIREQIGAYPRLTIGRDTWIGDRAIVMADVGRHCVVGAGSVVTKPVPDYAIVVGNPGRQIGSRTTNGTE